MELEYIIIGVIVVVVVAGVIYTIISTNKIKKDGVEAEAEVWKINIERLERVDESGMVDVDTNKHYVVRFKNEQGQTIDSNLVNPKMNLQEGDKIKIKYLPEKTKNVVMVK